MSASMAVLQEVDTYVFCFQSTVVQYIVTSTIVDLYLVKKCRTGPRKTMRWLEQKELYLVGISTAVYEA